MRIKSEAPTRSMHRRPPVAHGLEGIRLVAGVLVVILLLLIKVTAMEPGNWAEYGHLADEVNDGISTAAESLLGGGTNAGPAGRATLGEGSRSRPTSTGVRNEMARPSSFGHSYAGSPASARYHHRHASGSTYSQSSLPPFPDAGAKRPFDEGGSSSAVRSVHQRPAAPSQPLRADSGLYSDTRAYLSTHPPTGWVLRWAKRQFAEARDKNARLTGPFPQSLKAYSDKLESTNKDLYSKLVLVAHPNDYVSYEHPDKQVFAPPKHTDAAMAMQPRFSTFKERRVLELLLLEHLSDRVGWKATLNGPIFVTNPHKLFREGRKEWELLALFNWDNDVIRRPPLVSLNDFNINGYRIEIGQSLDYPGSPYALPIYPVRARHILHDEQIQVGFLYYPLSSDAAQHLLRLAAGHHHNDDAAMLVNYNSRWERFE